MEDIENQAKAVVELFGQISSTIDQSHREELEKRLFTVLKSPNFFEVIESILVSSFNMSKPLDLTNTY